MPIDSIELFIAGAGGAGAGGVAAYYAAKEAINVALARLDERLTHLRAEHNSTNEKVEELAREVWARK